MARKIIFIVIDQLRADCVNGALAASVQMPNLRALMKESVTFNRHYSVTVPCGPARASLFTGLYAFNHRSIRNGTPLSASHPTIAQEMRKAGYDPLLFGYTDTSIDPAGLDANDPVLKSYEGVAPGYSEIVRMRSEENSSWIADLKFKGYEIPKYYYDLFRPVDGERNPSTNITDAALYSSDDSDTAFLTDQTLRELSVRTGEDWFSTLTYVRPHPPLVAPAPYNSMYQPNTRRGPWQPLSVDQMRDSHPFYKAYFSGPSALGLHMGFDGRLDNMSQQTTAQLRAVYFGLASEVDHHIGRVLEFLRQTGQYEQTLIIITADHGEMLGEHHMWGKNAPLNASFHVPLIIRDPDYRDAAGTKVDAFTESIDIAPTLLDWAGLPPSPGHNGLSLMDWVKGGAPKHWRDHMFAEMDMGDGGFDVRFHEQFNTGPTQTGCAILQDDQFKLVHFNGGVKPLLYDMKADPHEVANLAQDPGHATQLLTMSQKMLNHRMTHAHHALSRMELTSKGLVVN